MTDEMLQGDAPAPQAPAGVQRRPATRPGRIAMNLGFAATGIGVLMWILMMVTYWITMATKGSALFMMPVYAVLIGADVVCAVGAIVMGLRVRRTDRSTMGTLALVLGGLAGAFWLLAVLLEIAGAVFGWE